MHRIGRLTLAIALVGALALLVAGCDRIVYTPSPEQATTTTGEPVPLEVEELRYSLDRGCSGGDQTEKPEKRLGSEYRWMIRPSTGATVDDGVFVATRPGTYKVYLVDEGDNRLSPGASTIVVTGEAIAEPGGDVSAPAAPDANPLVGTWTHMVWQALQQNGSTAFHWVEVGPVTMPFYEADGKVTSPGFADTVQWDGTTVSFTIKGANGFSADYTGTLGGDVISGTAAYHDPHLGTKTAPWTSTRVR